MPKGNPSKQTVASEKYQKKVGYISKSYKLKKELTEEFAMACEAAGTSAAKQLSEMMQSFIDSQREKEV